MKEAFGSTGDDKRIDAEAGELKRFSSAILPSWPSLSELKETLQAACLHQPQEFADVHPASSTSSRQGGVGVVRRPSMPAVPHDLG